ncbi:MAG: bifunctional 3-deoxy-7-phosphoheptulonate synthase/chorismate mutase type II [Bacteroidales bacterium]|nr:bifunctional 3-deoxy-7-phosphoheptulonate synthase/chorismate mutase type II [Bacteroidales bacterium]
MIQIICGPCSAESEEQVLATASALVDVFAGRKDYRHIAFRAGLWKPRTRPGTFEGVGEEGLPWLQRVRSETGLKVIVEVATPAHLEAVLEAGIDMIWIGARTTANPFAVQDLADALQGVDIPVFVKNPLNPDLDLWLGAVERLEMAGVRDITVIHRGFSFYEKGRYRNQPKWQVPIDLMRRRPDLKILCDPSHISGKREYIQEISQMAMNLGFDGLFIESHISPDSALSDADQQIEPRHLARILDNIKIGSSIPEDEELTRKLQEFRARIDLLDENILEILALRMGVVDQIGEQKRRGNITILQQQRWEEILEKTSEGAAERNLDQAFVEELFKLIHMASIKRQV